MFETVDIDTVGTTYDICVEREITSTTLGRHLNDHAFSFYFRNPSGWHFEYGWGAALDRPGDVADRALQRDPAAGRVGPRRPDLDDLTDTTIDRWGAST